MPGRVLRLWLAASMGVATLCAAAAAQTPGPTVSKSKADFWIQTGIMKVIPPEPQPDETYTQPRPVVELIENPGVPTWSPNYTTKGPEDPVHRGETLRYLAKQATFRRNIWNLEFAFKPLRMIEVDLPQATGKMQRKQLWYMVYKVKNNGYHQGVVKVEDKWKHATYDLEAINQNVFFFPSFALRATVVHTKKAAEGQFVYENEEKEYLDRVVPIAMKPIAERERVGAPLHDSVSITKTAIPVSDSKVDRSVWGVAIWEDVDPRTDFFMVYVEGLTNAYKFVDPPGGYKAGDPPGTGRTFSYKTLQVNFWRPGDSVYAHEEEIRFGTPLDPSPTRQEELLKLYKMPAPLDHQWIYR